MRFVIIRLCRIASWLLPATPLLVLVLSGAQSAAAQPAAAPPAAAASSAVQLEDPAAFVERQFGPGFKLDPKVPPMFGDLDGDGNEDVVLVGTSSTPLMSQEGFRFRVEDPYDAYYGTGNPVITSQFTLHFDGSSRCFLIVFGWRLATPAKPKAISKFVLINTPFETAGLVNLRLKKKEIQAIEAIDRTTLHALVYWDGKHWHWNAQGMEGDQDLIKMPPQN
jgi:hypothetical protein